MFAGNASLAELPPDIIKNKYLCEKHFDALDFRGKKSFYLKDNAVPKPFHEDSSFKVLTPEKTYSRGCFTMVTPKKTSASLNKDQTGDQKFVNELTDLTEDCQWTPRKIELKRRLIFKTNATKNYQKRLKRLQCKRVLRRKSTISEILPLLSILSTVAKTFVLMQLKGKRKVFTKAEKEFALALYYKSPAAYHFLRRRGIILPGSSTIRNWIGQNSFKPGIDEGLLSHLKIMSDSFTAQEKKCVLAFDEMTIKENIEYNKKLDYIEGFEDLGPLGRSSKRATHALVFLIRGLYKNWKLPISYFLSRNSLDKNRLKDLVLYNLNSVISAGLIPKAIVCDQGTNNRGALSLLGVNEERPFFCVGGLKIFSIYDIPHLFKSIRNNWLTGDFKYCNKVFSFNVIKKIYELDSSSTTAKALPKLSEKHLNPNNFEKMKCSLALQIFSNSVAAAIRTAIETGQLQDPEARNTSDFIADLNNLFDSLNSKRLFTTNPYNCGLSEKNQKVFSAIKKGKTIFESIVKVQVNKNKLALINTNPSKKIKLCRESRPPCFSGIIQSINAILGLYEMEKCKNSFLLTNRLNQDCLENFFSVIRQRGGWCLNPTARTFRLAFRIQTITGLLKPSTTSNCEDNNNNYPHAQSLTPFFSKSSQKNIYKPSVQCSSNNIEDLSDSQGNNSTDEEFDVLEKEGITAKVVTLEDCAMSYYAGYLVKLTKQKFKCANCSSIMENSNKFLTDPHQLLLLNRNYGISATFLTVPSSEIEQVLAKSMKLFRKYFTTYKEQEMLATKLKNKCLTRNAFWLGKKGDQCYEHKVFLLSKMVDVNLYKFCKWSQLNNKEPRKPNKPNQKIINIKNL